MKVYFKKLYDNSTLPIKAHYDDAGYDLFAHSVSTIDSNGKLNIIGGFNETANINICANTRVLVKCGFNMLLPYGFEAQIRSRSGLALKHGICVLNSPGTIDSSYTGEIGVILYNTGQQYSLKFGDKIAQMVIQQLPEIECVEVDELPQRPGRGTSGFGSSGR